MRRAGMWLLALALAAGVCACAGGKEPFVPEQTAQALIECGAFSEELEELDARVALRYYGLNEDDVLELAVYASTGSTAEEVAVFAFVDEGAAQAGEALMAEHLAYMKESNQDYRPQEMPKLDRAVVERRGSSLLYLVAADEKAAKEVLGE